VKHRKQRFVRPHLDRRSEPSHTVARLLNDRVLLVALRVAEMELAAANPRVVGPLARERATKLPVLLLRTA
jgi:hypothetical protein